LLFAQVGHEDLTQLTQPGGWLLTPAAMKPGNGLYMKNLRFFRGSGLFQWLKKMIYKTFDAGNYKYLAFTCAIEKYLL
jgi:hypothetical protein